MVPGPVSKHAAALQVATWDDPASARLGESLYMFVPRSVVGNLRDGWMAETKRLTTRQLPFLSSHNRCTAPVSDGEAASACIPISECIWQCENGNFSGGVWESLCV